MIPVILIDIVTFFTPYMNGLLVIFIQILSSLCTEVAAKNYSRKMAENKRFELSKGCPLHAFQACAFDHSANSPF